MTGRNLLLIGLMFATCTGCLHRHADVSMLENELRWMEDQMFMLEDELQRKQRQLATCQSSAGCGEVGNYTVIQDYAVTDVCPIDSSNPSVSPRYEVLPPSESAPNRRSTPRDEPTPADRSPGASSQYEILDENGAPKFAPEGSTTEPPAELNLDVEELDSEKEKDAADPDMFAPPDISLPLDNQSTRAAPRSQPGSIALSSHEDELESSTDQLDTHVTHVVVKAWFAHGHGFEGLERDVDLLVCVEPRNANAKVIPLGAELSLVILDATKSGEDARVARWDYTAAEARRLLRRSEAGHGIHLELPWPEDKDVASNADLHVFARYVTVEDQFLEADARVQDAFRGPEAVQRAGWRRAHHEPDAHTAEVDADAQLPRVRSKIKLRPIPKAHDDSLMRLDAIDPDHTLEASAPRVSRSEELPTILPEDDVPTWRPDR